MKATLNAHWRLKIFLPSVNVKIITSVLLEMVSFGLFGMRYLNVRGVQVSQGR